jgi:ADP-heptose:LPS heptosyltransferase
MSYILLTWLLTPIWWPIALLRGLRQHKPARIVIFEIAGIGDVICSANLLSQLRQTYPTARIDLVIDPIANTLAPALTMVDRVIPFAYAAQRGLAGRLRLMRLCLSYDTALCLIPSAAQITGFCLAALPRRLSVLPLPLNTSYRLLVPMLTARAEHPPGAYFLETQAQLFKKLGLLHPDMTKTLDVPNRDVVIPGLNPGARHIGLLVGSGRALKRVPLKTLASLVTQLVQDTAACPVQVFLIGGPADTELAGQIKHGVPLSAQAQVQDLSGLYALAELPTVLRQLDLLIGVDSGVTHMADALGVPILCIAGPVDLGEVYATATTRRQFVITPLSCYPCSRVFDTPATCHQGTVACLTTLDPDAIARQAMLMLEMPSKATHA